MGNGSSFAGTAFVTRAGGAGGILALLLTACSSTAAQQARTQAPSDVVATVGSTSITLAQVDERALQQSTGTFAGMKLSQALYEARRAAVDDMVDDALIDQDGKARKLDRATVIEQEITAKVERVSDGDVAAWFQQNQSRLQGATLDQTRTAIASYLLQQRTLTARQQYVDRLRSKAAIHVTLEPPRQVIARIDRPSKGPANAPVEMIEFSDFQCPFCLSAFPTVAQVVSTYGDRVHLVYRHYPLTNHPNARPAAEASQCAEEQGQFWRYHDLLFGDPSHLADADLKQRAAQLGLDTAQFNACVDTRKYKSDVDTDIRAGDEAGVNGTPAFFINGRVLSGAQPFEVFKRIIDEELEGKKR